MIQRTYTLEKSRVSTSLEAQTPDLDLQRWHTTGAQHCFFRDAPQK